MHYILRNPWYIVFQNAGLFCRTFGEGKNEKNSEDSWSIVGGVFG
jgi:hypothetical protein